jgi:hypothetical protein
MSGEELFENLPEMAAPKVAAEVGAPRLRQPERGQVELRACDLDSLLASDHPARVIWAYVERLGRELEPLYAVIKAREGVPGHPPIDPRLMLALWLYATSEGIGSGRALAKLCESHDAYRWLTLPYSVSRHNQSHAPLHRLKLTDVLHEARPARIDEHRASEPIRHPLDREEALVLFARAIVFVREEADRITSDLDRTSDSQADHTRRRIGENPLKADTEASKQVRIDSERGVHHVGTLTEIIAGDTMARTNRERKRCQSFPAWSRFMPLGWKTYA